MPKFSDRPRVYLAGPDVFERDPYARGEELKAVVAGFGLEGVFPLDAELSGGQEPGPELGLLIHSENERLIQECDAVLANLTPFRGPSADVGTVYEIGYARGIGKLIVGYTHSDARLLERTVDWVHRLGQEPQRRPDGALEDGERRQIEAFGLHDNLMIDGGIRSSGGTIVAGGNDPVRRAAELLAQLLRDR